MKRSINIWIFFTVVLLIPLSVYALYTWFENRFEQLPVFKNEHLIENFSFTNQSNKNYNYENWNKKIVVANYFFTHCPTICPKMMKNLTKVQKAYAGEKNIIINSFSVDPERDNATQLKQYAMRFGINTANWQLLTGDKKELYRLARNGFGLVATDGDGGPDDFIHSENMVLIDKQKRIRGYYKGTDEKEIDKLIHDIKKLKDEEE